ncbi:MAG: hypothetical protein J5518_09485 [Lachnospiraceae bacterium]|nr:hypothetical protein [Lachnospiraceae bacterium]
MRKMWEGMKGHGRRTMSGVKRLIAGFLSFAMILSYMPANVYANEAAADDTAVYEEAVTPSAEETVNEGSNVAEEVNEPAGEAAVEESYDYEVPLAEGYDDAGDAEVPDEAWEDEPEQLRDRTDYEVTVNDLTNIETTGYVAGMTYDEANDKVYVNEDTDFIVISFKTAKDKDKDDDSNYGIKNVTAKIGDDDAVVTKYKDEDGRDIVWTDGGKFSTETYVIKKEDGSVINAAVNINVETKKVHFVGFASGENASHIGCVPIPDDESDFVPTSPWQGGVFVFDGGKMPFRFRVELGYAVTGVRQGNGGPELLQTDENETERTITHTDGKTYIETPRYITGAIDRRTYIYTDSIRKNAYLVDFNTGDNSQEIAIVPDGGDFIPNTNFNRDHGVYVYEGGVVSFHFRVNEGYGVTKVTQGKNIELSPEEDVRSRYEVRDPGPNVIETASYESGLINGKTTIYVDSESIDVNHVTFASANNIKFVPEGDFIEAENGVYVYDGDSLYFQFELKNGALIKKVTQSHEGGDVELITTEDDWYDEDAGVVWTGTYLSDPIEENTQITVESGTGVFLYWSNNPEDEDYRNAEIYLLNKSFKKEYEEAVQSYEEWNALDDAGKEEYENEHGTVVRPQFNPEEYRLSEDMVMLVEGLTYYIEVIPAYGYQIGGNYGPTGTDIEGTLFTPTEEDFACGVWSFTAENDDFMDDIIVKPVAGADGFADKYDADGNPALDLHSKSDSGSGDILDVKMELEDDGKDFSDLAACGGTLRATVTYDEESNLTDEQAPGRFNTFGFVLEGETWKGIQKEDEQPWKNAWNYGLEGEEGSYPELVKVTLELGNDANAENYKLYWEREEEGEYYATVWGSCYNKQDHELTFSTNINGTFTIAPTVNVLFDLSIPADYRDPDQDHGHVFIKPVEPMSMSGLVEVTENTTYKYIGYGPIRLQVVDENGNPIGNLSRYKEGFLCQYLLNMFAGRKDGENGPEIPFDFFINDDGTVEIPAVDYEAWDPEYITPITNMIQYAEGPGDHTIYASTRWNNRIRPASQIILNGKDESVTYSGWQMKPFADKVPDDPEYEEPVYADKEPFTVESVTDGEGNVKKYYYLEDYFDSFRFKLEEKGGYKLESVTYRVINWYEDENGEAKYEPATGYTGLTKLAPEDGYYEIPLPQPRGHYEVVDEEGNEQWVIEDWGVNLGVEIIPHFKKLATVKVQVKKADGTSMDAQYLDASVRIDAAAYEVTPKKASETDPYNYEASVPQNSTVTVTLTSPDGLWAVSNVQLTDVKNNNKALKAAKNGEYTLTVADEGLLVATIAPVTKVVVEKGTLEGGDYQYTALKDEKNVYSLKTGQVFRAYLADRSEWNGTSLVAHKVENVDFFNGRNKLETVANEYVPTENIITVEDSELIATGEAFGVAKLSLKASVTDANNKVKSYSTTINFTGSTVAVTSPKPNYGAIELPYGQKATVKVDIGGNLKGVTAWICEYDPNTDTINKIDPDGNFALLGSFDGKTITIDPKKAAKHPQAYKPNTWLELCFFDANGNKIDEGWYSVYSLYFAAPTIAGKAAPTVTANAALSTNCAVGLTLGLPKGVKAVDGMYYRIEATAVDKGNVKYTNGGKKYYDHLAQYDENDGLNSVFLEEVVAFVPATEKSWSVDVSDKPRNDEDGWRVDYAVKATLVYAEEFDDEHSDEYDHGYRILKFKEGEENKTQQTEEFSGLTVSTKDNTFETKLSLTKQMPAKIYNKQDGIPLAIPKWSKSASVQKLDRVELLNEYGYEVARWDRWGEDMQLDVDKTGLITLDTTWEWMDEVTYESGEDHLAAGKYTLVAYAIGGPGAQASATLPVTLLESIESMTVSAPARVLKTYNKAATVKAEVAFNVNEWENAPATKNVEWSIVVPDGSPLEGKLTMKNGTVTIDKDLMVDAKVAKEDPDAYSFVIAAKAADFEDNDLTEYSDPILITSEAQVPTEIQFAWDQYDDNGNLTGWDYSDINEQEIARKAQALKAKDIYMEPFYSRSIQYAKVFVLDQYGEQMYADLKLTGIKQNEDGRLILSKAGKVSVTATAVDGSKKSKKIEFTIADGDARFTPNVLVQTETQFYRGDRDKEFINTYDRFDHAGETWCSSNAPANKYLYVHVGAAHYADIGEENGNPVLFAWDRPSYGDIVMFNHTVKVKGGTIKATLTDAMDKYTTYVILPSAEETVVTVTDNTVDKRFGRAKNATDYTICNQLISNQKARKITADKASLVNWMWTDWDGYATSPENPNYVTYTIKDFENRPRTQYFVKITMDELSNGALSDLARVLCMPNNDEEYEAFKEQIEENDEYIQEKQEILDWYDATPEAEEADRDMKLAMVWEKYRRPQEEECFHTFENDGVMRPVKNGKFSIGFFSPKEDYWDGNNRTVCEFPEIPAGTYNFYVTYGYLDYGNFVPLEQPTKMSVKFAAAPVPAVKFDTTKFTFTKTKDGEFEYINYKLPINATVTKGRGLRLDPEERFCYEIVSANNNGVTNDFRNLFYVRVAASESSTGILKDENVSLRPNFGFGDENSIWITVGTGNNARGIQIRNWEDLKALKNGTFYVKDDEETRWRGELVEGVHLVGSQKDQQSAYKAWSKANSSGILRCTTIGYDGRERTVDTKVTVNLDFLVDNGNLLAAN